MGMALSVHSNRVSWEWSGGNNAMDIWVNGVEYSLEDVTHTKCVILNIS